jgi:hypothetical protein
MLTMAVLCTQLCFQLRPTCAIHRIFVFFNGRAKHRHVLRIIPLSAPILKVSDMDSGFSSVPLLDYKLSQSPSTKAKFLTDLQYAVSHVGFLYLANPPVPAISELLPYIPKAFDLPQEAKDQITMRNSPHFLGYSRLGTELTKGATDQREQFDFATPHICRWKDGDPDYYRLWGPSQVWPAVSTNVNFT